ncbi:hypothetical protein [Methanococcus aeolicus]|uniref:hypothetical protein n=1 Tax=Methanococcus aeolicus TaxID=42879 RepID=UPI0021C94BB2|nr:hypothetical protein [Methanococcus aeolicus]UXM85027.1 hypothetical protein N6C89_01725 [Methanococcus aeolicus]
MKKIFFVVLLLYFILGVSGELWEDNITNIEDSKTTTDITETFNFPYDLDDITIQNMIVEVNANDVDVGGSDYDEIIYIYNTSSNYNLLGELPIGTSFRKFIITDIINNTYYSQGHDRLALKGNTPYKSNNLNIVIYNITGGTQEINDTIGSNKKIGYLIGVLTISLK